MKLDEHAKIDIVKAFTEQLKARRGRGPKNIYIKQIKDETRLISEGVLSEFEKHVIQTFGETILHQLEQLLRQDLIHMEQAIKCKLCHKFNLSVDFSECDLVNDRFTYILKFD